VCVCVVGWMCMCACVSVCVCVCVHWGGGVCVHVLPCRQLHHPLRHTYTHHPPPHHPHTHRLHTGKFNATGAYVRVHGVGHPVVSTRHAPITHLPELDRFGCTEPTIDPVSECVCVCCVCVCVIMMSVDDEDSLGDSDEDDGGDDDRTVPLARVRAGTRIDWS